MPPPLGSANCARRGEVSMEVLMKAAVKEHRYTLGSLMSDVFGQWIGVALVVASVEKFYLNS